MMEKSRKSTQSQARPEYLRYCDSLSLKDQALFGVIGAYYLYMGEGEPRSEELAMEWMKKHIAKREAGKKRREAEKARKERAR